MFRKIIICRKTMCSFKEGDGWGKVVQCKRNCKRDNYSFKKKKGGVGVGVVRALVAPYSLLLTWSLLFVENLCLLNAPIKLSGFLLSTRVRVFTICIYTCINSLYIKFK